MRYSAILPLSTGHFFTDLNQGALPALLPFFISEQHLSYAAAASLVFASTAASSVTMPILGYISDLSEKVWLMPLGILLAGVGIGLSGTIDSFPLIMTAVCVSGFGASAFHPDAARMVNMLSSNNKALGLSIFAVGGSAGFAAGPLLATGAVLTWGIGGTLVFICPAVFMAIFLIAQNWHGSRQKNNLNQTDSDSINIIDQWSPFIKLSGIVIARSILFFGLNIFIPLYWINVLHQSNIAGATALTLLFTLGIFATLLCGRIADNWSCRKVIMTGFGLLLPALAVFPFVRDPIASSFLLIPISIGIFGTYSPMIAAGQRFLPSRVGFASGITIGIAATIGGLAAPFLGWLADLYGIQAAIQSLIVIPVLAMLLTISLPDDKRKIS